MTAIPAALLKRIEEWCAEHATGQIVLNVADHQVKTYQFSEHGKVSEETTSSHILEALSPDYTAQKLGRTLT